MDEIMAQYGMKEPVQSTYRRERYCTPLPFPTYLSASLPSSFPRLDSSLAGPDRAKGKNEANAALQQCRALHPFLRQTVLNHFHDQVVQDIVRKPAHNLDWNDRLFDLEVLRRAFDLLERFYREKQP